MQAESFISKAWRDVTRNILAFFGFATRRTLDKVTGAGVTPLAHAWGLGASYVIDAYISYRDYKHEEERLRAFFEPEIAATLGKHPAWVTTKDLYKVAKSNPAIAEAVGRNKTTRNLSFGTSATAITIAVITTSVVLAALSLTGIGAFAAGMVIGLSVFLGAETVLDKIGRKLFGLAEPDLRDVSRTPALQHSLSLSSQIRFLEQLQSRRGMISQEQVFTAFLAANPALGQRIVSEYGAPFAALDDAARTLVLGEIGQQYGVERVASDLNNRLIRPQELAFTVYGQNSGVQKLDTPNITALELAQQKLTAAQQKIGELSEQVKEKAAHLGTSMMEKSRSIVAAAREKLPFRKAQVSAVVPEHQFTAKETLRGGQQQVAGQAVGA